MTKEEFWKRVDTQLHRPNDKERYALRDELEAHIEDHTLALEETGCPAEEAEARAVEAMGEPEEIGKALNNQFSVFWQVMIWVGTLVIMVLVWNIITNGYTRYGSLYKENRQARTEPLEQHFFLPAVEEQYPVSANPELRMPMENNDELYIYWVGFDPETNRAALEVTMYDLNPVGWVARYTLEKMWVENQAGERFYRRAGGSDVCVGYVQYKEIAVAEDDTCITLCYEKYGNDLAIEVPLPREVSQ